MMLYVVATPIGNLSDITERAREILCAVTYVACEDTRHSHILLKSIGSDAKTISFHAHSEDAKIEAILDLLEQGQDVALISDAGVPGLADPGGVLVERVHQLGIPISPLPGPSSITAALSVCGFPADQFIFYGFVPKKKGRLTMLESLRLQKMPAVLFESPHRIAKLIHDLHDILGGERRICLCRELTKQFEEVWMGSLEAALARGIREQGEFVVVVEGQ